MKHDLPCAVVRDLLPNYLEGLTSGETDQAMAAPFLTAGSSTT